MIKITEDLESDMLRIEYNNKCIFEGNFTDFNRSGEGFKNLFRRMDLDVEVIQEVYDNWYFN